ISLRLQFSEYSLAFRQAFARVTLKNSNKAKRLYFRFGCHLLNIWRQRINGGKEIGTSHLTVFKGAFLCPTVFRQIRILQRRVAAGQQRLDWQSCVSDSARCFFMCSLRTSTKVCTAKMDIQA